MTDSTSNHVPIDYDEHAETIENLFVSVEECEIFNEALLLFERAALNRNTQYDENGMHHTAVGVLSQASESLVAATAHYHYANVLATLDEIVKASAEATPAVAEEA